MKTKLIILFILIFAVAGCQNNQTPADDLTPEIQVSPTPDNKSLALQAGMSEEAFARFDELVSKYGNRYELIQVRQPSDLTKFKAMTEKLKEADEIWCVTLTNYFDDGTSQIFYTALWSDGGKWVDVLFWNEKGLNSPLSPSTEEKAIWQQTNCLD